MDIQIGDEEVWPVDIKNIVKEKLEKNGELLDKAITLSEIQSRIEMYNYQIGREENEEEKNKLEKKLKEIQKEYDDKKEENTGLVRESKFAIFRKNIKEKIKNGIEEFKNKFSNLKNMNKKEEKFDDQEKEKAKVDIDTKEKNAYKEDIVLERDTYKYDEITKNNIRNIDKYIEENENINKKNEENLEEKNKEINIENEIKKVNNNYLDYNNDEREI